MSDLRDGYAEEKNVVDRLPAEDFLRAGVLEAEVPAAVLAVDLSEEAAHAAAGNIMWFYRFLETDFSEKELLLCLVYKERFRYRFQIQPCQDRI